MQREAVLAGGAGDYSSMIYGDKEAVPPGSGNQTETLVTPTVTEKVEKEREKEIVEMTKAMALEPATSVSASTAAPVVPSGLCYMPIISFIVFLSLLIIFKGTNIFSSL